MQFGSFAAFTDALMAAAAYSWVGMVDVIETLLQQIAFSFA